MALPLSVRWVHSSEEQSRPLKYLEFQLWIGRECKCECEYCQVPEGACSSEQGLWGALYDVMDVDALAKACQLDDSDDSD